MKSTCGRTSTKSCMVLPNKGAAPHETSFKHFKLFPQTPFAVLVNAVSIGGTTGK
jgi:hypothetical protein